MVVLGQYGAVLLYDGAVSVQGGTGWYLIILGQKKAILVDT